MKQPLRILIVEDNPGDVDLIREMVPRSGLVNFHIFAVEQLSDALPILQRREVDIALLDMDLPDSSGLETIRRVRTEAPAVPIVVLTGNDDEEIGLAATHEGAQDYMVKGQLDYLFLPRVLRHAFERGQEQIRLQHLNQVLKALRNVNQLITRERDPAQLIRKACWELVETRGYLRSWIVLLDHKGNVIDAAEQGHEGSIQLFLDGIKPKQLPVCCRSALQEAAPIIVKPGDEDCSDCPLFGKNGKNHAMVSALGYEEEIYGFLGISLPEYISVDEEEQMLLSEMADDIAYAIHNIELHRNRDREAEALRESRAKFRAMVDNVGIGVALISPELTILELNRQMRDWFPEIRVKDSPLCYKAICATGHDAPHGACPAIETFADGQVHDATVQIPRDDEVRTYRIVSSPIRDAAGGIGAVIEMVEDISHRILLEKQFQQVQRMESIGTLAGGIAHDFNNLLTIIQGYSEILLDGKGERDPSYTELKAVNEAATRGAELVKRILTFSRQVEINLRPVNLNEEVKNAEKLLYRTIPKMIDIELLLAKDLKSINADAGQMEQIILNLAINARDAMPEGGKLTLKTQNVILGDEYCKMHVEATPGEYVMLVVADTGHGISQDALDRIFEPFFTTKRPGEGTGLGLAMVFGIVKAHGGHVKCESELGSGTTFKIYLPVGRGIDMAPGQYETFTQMASGTETILLVDDEDAIRELGRRILTRAGYSVLQSKNGTEALEVFSSKKAEISLVILDLIMPEMGGKQCLEELLKIDPEANAIIASGFFPQGQDKEFLERAAKGSVSKPFKSQELLREVRKILDSR